LAAKDAKIEGYQAGIERLKGYKNAMFPNWKALAIAD
jgi:hypothetical protein